MMATEKFDFGRAAEKAARIPQGAFPVEVQPYSVDNIRNSYMPFSNGQLDNRDLAGRGSFDYGQRSGMSFGGLPGSLPPGYFKGNSVGATYKNSMSVQNPSVDYSIM